MFAPNVGSIIGMKLVGQTHLEEAVRCRPDCADALRAWESEIRHRTWKTAAALTPFFRGVDPSRLPVATFRLGSPALRIETLIDMRTGVVLVTNVSAVVQ